MSKGLEAIIPIAIVGGIGYYIYESGILSSLFGSSATTTNPSNPPATNPNTLPTNPTAPGSGTTTPPAVTSCPQYYSLVNGMCKQTQQIPGQPCGPGQTQMNGVCVTAPSTQSSVVQTVIAAAQRAGVTGNLNVDQWNYYYAQLGGVGPDPGLIPANAWQAIGGGDRTTAITADQWFTVMNMIPGVSLSGLGSGLGRLLSGLGLFTPISGMGQVLDPSDFYNLTKEPLIQRGMF